MFVLKGTVNLHIGLGPRAHVASNCPKGLGANSLHGSKRVNRLAHAFSLMVLLAECNYD